MPREALVEPEPAGGHRTGEERVENDRGAPVARPARLQRGGEDGGRERKQRRREEQAEVRPLEARVDPVDAREGVVVVQPDHADVEERADVGDVRAPEVNEVVQELPTLEFRDRQVEHEQRDRDREDTVGERFDPAGVAHEAPSETPTAYRSYGSACTVRRRGSSTVKKRGSARSRSQARSARAASTPSMAVLSPPSATNGAGDNTEAATSAASSTSAFACSTRRRRKRFDDEPPFLLRFFTKREPTLEVTIRSPSSIPMA